MDRYLTSSDHSICAVGSCVEIEALCYPDTMSTMHAARALARTLIGATTPVRRPTIPVIVRTSSTPVVAAPPPRESVGERYSPRPNGRAVCQFEDPQESLLNFALTGSGVGEKQALTAQLPAIMD